MFVQAFTVTLNDRKVSIPSYRFDPCHPYQHRSHVVSA